MRKLIIFIGLFLSLTSEAQTYTFECVASGRLSGDSCDICPNTIVESRSFNGLVIYRDSAFYRWVDQPYSIRVKPGGLVEYWEHSVNPFSERITIPFDLTGCFEVVALACCVPCSKTRKSLHQRRKPFCGSWSGQGRASRKTFPVERRQVPGRGILRCCG